jgi:uncharacterized membrane protein
LPVKLKKLVDVVSCHTLLTVNVGGAVIPKLIFMEKSFMINDKRLKHEL